MPVPHLLLESLLGKREKLIEYQKGMTALPALGPDNGGSGEMPKALYLEALLRRMGCRDIMRIDALDRRVPDGVRPNIIARLSGKSPRTLWILGHMDVVPPGELSHWHTDPWTAVVDGDVIRGRGVEDNQQAIVCGLLLMEALLELDLTPDLSLGLLFVSDEETSNAYGIEYVLRNKSDLFRLEDFVVVPDYGVPDGSCIEVAEKGQLWLKITVSGVQSHASRPHEGRNSLVAAADMIMHVSELEHIYPRQDTLFTPSSSTFVPTRHEENVPNINSLPGRDTFYMDCRLLPGISHEAVVCSVREIMAKIADQHGVKVDVDVIQSSPAAPATSETSEVVRRLTAGIQSVYQVTPRCIGVGGGTVAAGFRRLGIPAAVWASVVPTFHLANEYSHISKNLGDAQVLAHMLFDEDVSF